MSILKLRKRLFRNNGSVLFIVLVVMSMLIIAATVTYYIVNNQNASVEVHYASEQSYQTARSLLNTVDRFLTKQFDAMAASGDSLKPYKDTLAGRMINMAVDTTIDTTPIDLNDMGLGDATLSIKRVNGRASDDPDILNQYYEVTVNAEVNGESTSLTQVRMVQVGTSTYFTRFLTCTGKRGEDVRIGAGDIYGVSYFENEFTEWVTSAPSKLNESIYSSGSLQDDGIQYQRPSSSSGKYMEAVIKENYIIVSPSGTDLDVPYLFVGGDFINGPMQGMDGSGGKSVTSDAVYVVGNYYKNAKMTENTKFFIGGDCHIEAGGSENSTYYINGDLYLFEKPTTTEGLSSQGTFYVSGNVYIGNHMAADYNFGMFKNVFYSGSLLDQNGAAKTTTSPRFTQDTSVGNTIATALAASNPVAEVKSFTSGVNSVEDYIRAKTTKNIYKPWKAEKFFDDNLRDSAQNITLASSSAVTTTGNAVILNSMTSGNSKLIVDATSNDVYVYLNGEVDADGKKTFVVKNQSDILVRGKHAVILILPEDTDFKMEAQTVVGNSELLAACTYGRTAEDFETNFGGNLHSLQKDAAKNVMELDGGTVTKGSYQIPAEDSITKIKSSYSNASNSIFLVTTGNSNLINLNDQCAMTGYIYAPNGRMTVNGGSGNPQVIGGMIAGSYSYINSATGLYFVQPYDYANNNANIVTRLISEANSSGSSDPEDDISFKGASVIGYK